jgi:hypothetical protein
MSEVSMKMRVTTFVVLLAFCTMVMASTGAMAATAPTPPTQKAVFVQGSDSSGDLLNGVFTITSFANQSGQLVAQGTLNGNVTTASGNVMPVVNQSMTMPVSSVASSCPILTLVLGPLNLNILGLNIALNQVVLNITAIPGAGNLLGNLLCDIANLLNGTNLNNVLGELVILLNKILGAL